MHDASPSEYPNYRFKEWMQHDIWSRIHVTRRRTAFATFSVVRKDEALRWENRYDPLYHRATAVGKIPYCFLSGRHIYTHLRLVVISYLSRRNNTRFAHHAANLPGKPSH